MSFDIEDYIDGKLERLRPSAGDEMTAVCPNCDKFGSFYVNVKSGKYVCFKCEFKALSIVGLIAKLEGISWREARKYLFKQGVKLRKMEPATLEDEIASLRPGAEAEDEEKMVEVPLPEEFVGVYEKGKWRVPKYLKERGFTKRTLKRWGIGFCRSGRYADRIVIPIRCDNGYSFTARDATGAREPKYLNPKGADHNRLLCCYEAIEPGADIVLVEGPTDAMMACQNDLIGVGLLGKELHQAQLDLLRRARPGSIVVMLDPEEVTAPLKAARQLSYCFEDVYIAKLPEGEDPGSATRKQLHKAFNDAQRYKGERLGELEALLVESRASMVY